jgi:hypothetical protein
MSMSAVILFAVLNEEGAAVSVVETSVMFVFFASTTVMLFLVLYSESRPGKEPLTEGGEKGGALLEEREIDVELAGGRRVVLGATRRVTRVEEGENGRDRERMSSVSSDPDEAAFGRRAQGSVAQLI